MDKRSFYLVSLGCAKNTVDSDSMAVLLNRAGYQAVEKPTKAQILIVNTCGFIHDARQESLDELRTLARKKKKGQILIAAGCLTQRWSEMVVEKVPGIDAVLGTRRWMDIIEVIDQLLVEHPRVLYHLPETPGVGRDERGVLRAAVQGTSAYLKIADGCRRPCAFCAIPLIKGNLVSRPLEAILDDALRLEKTGIQEIILIAQDTTDYGHDLGLKDGLVNLLQQMLAKTQIPWLRIMYAYPGFVSDRLIELMASNQRVLPYLDIPLQHSHPETLRRMQRPANIDWVHKTIEKLRAAMPHIALRSTFIVGYPGETDIEFEDLLKFIQEVRFDRVGAFTYSAEIGTASYALGDSISPQVKQERFDRLMSIQTNISHAINRTFVGKTLDVLVEGSGQGIYIGRSYRDAPEIDGLVVFEGQTTIGEIVPVHIKSALPYDLTGVQIHHD